jgi:hypothetical protein
VFIARSCCLYLPGILCDFEKSQCLGEKGRMGFAIASGVSPFETCVNPKTKDNVTYRVMFVIPQRFPS